MEYIVFLLSALKDLVERLRNLKRDQLEDKQILFNEVVKPLFDDLQPVAINYMEIFRMARKIIVEGPDQYSLFSATMIRKQREEKLMERTKVSEMARQIIIHIKDPDVVDFAKAITYFFFADPEDEKQSRRTYEFVRKLNDPEFRRHGQVVQYIDDTLSILIEEWAKIVASYEKLKIHALAPEKYVNKKK